MNLDNTKNMTAAPPPNPDLLEALARRLALRPNRGLWHRLFAQGGAERIRFTAVKVALLAAALPAGATRDDLIGLNELPVLAPLHWGELDSHPPGAALVAFPLASRALDLALELQRSSPQARLRMGLHAGWAWTTRVESDGDVLCAHLGPTSEEAAHLALQATSGSIHISPAAYEELGDAVEEQADCLVTTEFSGTELTAVLLTLAPTRQCGFSTFAPLSMS